jgi:hypothetical protein
MDASDSYTISDLPNEIITSVFEYLPPRSLSALSCVGARYKALAERLLYSSVSITELISDLYPSPLRTARCCESLLSREHLWANVKRFHIRWYTEHGCSLSHPSTAPFDYVCQYIRGVLTKAVGLESLELALGPANMRAATFYRAGSLHAVERAIMGCQLPQLQYCHLGADGRHPYTSILSAFLMRTTLIQHLKLTDLSTSLNLAPEALPHLVTFRGSTATSASLLPGRPVTSLTLTGQDSDVTRDHLPQITRTTVLIRTLDLSGMTTRLMLLNHISKYLPHLYVLKIKLSLSHTLHYANTGLVSFVSWVVGRGCLLDGCSLTLMMIFL